MDKRDNQDISANAKLSMFPEINPNPVAEIDSEGNILYLNPAIKKKFPDIEILGMKHQFLAGLELVFVVFEKGRKLTFSRIVKIENTWYKEEMFYVPQNKVIHIYGFDITESKLIEEKLKESEEKYRSLIEFSGDAIFLADINTGLIIDANKEAEEILGFSRQEIIGWHFSKLHPPEDIIFYQKMFERVVKEGRTTISGENLYLLSKNGRKVPVSLSTNIISVGGKKLIQGVFRDISRLKETENALRREKEKIERYLDIAAAIIVVLDDSGKVSLINSLGAEVLGLRPDEIIGKNWFDNFVPERLRPEVKLVFKRLIAGEVGLLGYFENLIIGKDGQERLIAWNNTIFKDEDRNMVMALSSGTDITETRKAQDALIRAKDDLEIRVQKRTSELAKANVELHLEIEERFKAEEEIKRLNRQIEFILGSTKTGLDIIDADFNMVYVDPAWQKIYGDPKGKRCYEYFMDRQQVCDGCGVKKALETKRPVVAEEILIKENNRPVQVTTIPFQDETGKWFVAEINVDISERKKVEEALKNSEEQYRSLVDNVNIGIYRNTTGPEGRFLQANPAIAKMFGYDSVEEFMKVKVSDLYWSAQERAIFINEILMNGSVKNKELHLKNKNGQSIWGAVTANVKYDQKGNVEWLDGVIEDVTERKRIQEALEESQEHFERIVKTITDYIYTVKVEKGKAVKTLYGDACLAVTGYTAQEFEKDPYLWINIVYPEDRAAVLKQAERILKDGEIDAIEHRIIRKNGVLRWVRNTPVIHFDNEGVFVSYDGVIQDITDRKEAEAQKVRAEVLSSIIEGIPDAIVVIDISGKIKKFNRTLIESFCLGEKCLDRPLTELFLGKEKQKIYKKIDECILKGKISNFDAVALSKDKKELPVLLNFSVVKNNQGDVEFLVGVITDIAERKQLEELKDEFINTLSHELRTPLSAMKEGVTIVLSGMAGEINRKQHDCLKTANRNIDRLNRMIGNILDYQRMDYGLSKLEIGNNDINILVKEVKFSMIALAREKKLKINLKLDEKLPILRFDHDRITQVLVNLVNNAIKFTEKGSITIRTEQSENFINICVEDTGLGIRKESLDKLFASFSQIISGKLKREGAGLGLVISKKIIEQHNGKIWCESDYGKGSKFCFSLPLEQKEV